jgi:Ni/Co efflux regulator RcnB
MISRLPVHAGHEWRVVGTDLVLVAVATAIVVDILLDVFS